MAYIGKQPVVGNFQVCDAISVVNGQAAYTMQVGSTNVEPENANHMLVSLNGVLQKPGSSFTISGSTITFASNLATGDVIDFIILLGDTLNVGTPSDDSVGAAQIKNDLISGTTALTSAPDDTDELLISDAGTLKRIDVSLVGGSNSPRFQVALSSNQSTSTDTNTLVAFATEVLDSDNAFTNTSSNYKFTVPSGKAGVYFFYAQLNFADMSDNKSINVSLYKNGSEIHSGKERTPGNDQTVEVSAILNLSADDYIQVYGAQNNNSNVNINAGIRTYFFGFKLV